MDKRLEILVEEGLVDHDTLGGMESQRGESLLEMVLRVGAVSEEDYLRALSRRSGLPVYEPVGTPPPQEVLNLKLMSRFEAVPVRIQGETLVLAIADPFNRTCFEELPLFVGKRLEFMVTSPRVVSAALGAAELAGAADVSFPTYETLKDVELFAPPPTAEADDSDFDTLPVFDDGDDGIDDADDSKDHTSPIIQFVTRLVTAAFASGSSEVVIEPDEDGFRIRTRSRFTGRWTEPAGCRFPKRLHLPIVGRLKVMAMLDIAERRVPQEGSFHFAVGDETANVKVCCLPTENGEEICLSYAGKSRERLTFHELAIADAVREKLETTLTAGRGLVFVAGHSAEEASLTLEALAEHFTERDGKLLLVDDGSSLNIPHATRVQVENRAGLSAAQALRATLRHRPTVLVVDTSIDLEVAQLLFRVAERGTLVFTTLPVLTAPDTLARVIHMGIEPYLASTLCLAVLAERQIRLLCQACKKDSGHGPYPFVAGEGCRDCELSGYRGHQSVCDVLFPAEHLRKSIEDNSYWWRLRTEGSSALREAALALAREGRTSAAEALQKTSVP